MTCAACNEGQCGHPDPIYQGVVYIDDRSEPGSWARHIRHTECMRQVQADPAIEMEDRPFCSAPLP